MAPTTTPLTDAELDLCERFAVAQDGGMTITARAAAEIRALRASEARLLAALKRMMRPAADLMDWTQRLDDKLIRQDGRDPAKEPVLGELRRMADVLVTARETIRAAEGRAEG